MKKSIKASSSSNSLEPQQSTPTETSSLSILSVILIVFIFVSLSFLCITSLAIAIRVFNPAPCTLAASSAQHVEHGGPVGAASHTFDIGTTIAATLDALSDTLDEWLIEDKTNCHRTGVYNVSQYYDVLHDPYEDLVHFDNVRPPQDPMDATRTNHTYFPAHPSAQQAKVIGRTTPTLIGNTLNHARFRKYQSQNYEMAFFMNLSLDDADSRASDLPLFWRNVDERGPDNLAQRRYHAAMVKSKVVNRYAGHVKHFTASLYQAWVINGEPVLSTTMRHLITLHLELHLGSARVPGFVYDYFTDLLHLATVTDNSQDDAVRAMRGHMNNACVREYILGRLIELKQRGNTETFSWHWIKAGMPLSAVVSECIHGATHLSHFLHAVYLTTLQSRQPASVTPGTGGLSFLQLFRLASRGTGISMSLANPSHHDASLYNGTAEQLQLNVVREALRLLLPNDQWLSTDTESSRCSGCASHAQAHHVTQLIQLRGEYERANLTLPWSPMESEGWLAALRHAQRYDPMRYNNKQYMTQFSDATVPATHGPHTRYPFDASDTVHGVQQTMEAFRNNALDKETQSLPGDAPLKPVFAQPIYAVFGLGARRCPAEIFSQYLMLQLFETMQCLQFKDHCEKNESCHAPSVPIATFLAVPDSLYVSESLCK